MQLKDNLIRKNKLWFYTGLVSALVSIGVISSIYLFSSWHYLPLIYQGYGVDYNEERIRIGQPLVENYFIPQIKGGKRRQIWVTPDSIKHKVIHVSKNYNTKRGEIIYEADFYSFYQDSIKYVLKREYYYKFDSVSYQLKAKRNETEVIYDSLIDIETGDSVKHSWGNLMMGQ